MLMHSKTENYARLVLLTQVLRTKNTYFSQMIIWLLKIAHRPILFLVNYNISLRRKKHVPAADARA